MINRMMIILRKKLRFFLCRYAITNVIENIGRYAATEDHFAPAEEVKLFFAGTSPGKNMLTKIWTYRWLLG